MRRQDLNTHSYVSWLCPCFYLNGFKLFLTTDLLLLLKPSMSRREGGGGHLEEIVVPGSSHHMMALHNSSVGPSPYFPLDSPSLMYSYYLG